MKKIRENYGDSKNRYRLDDRLALEMGLTLNKSRRYRLSPEKVKELDDRVNKNPRLLVYDIETSRATFKAWWSGKTYNGVADMVQEPRIISIAWKWIGEDEVYHLTWDKDHSDEDMIREFMPIYNSADVIIGQNNDRFDNRWLVARAIKFGVPVNNYVRSFDIMKQMKRVARLPGYSMAFLTKYKGITNKQSHEGIIMWKMIEDGTPEQQEEYLKKMVDYNIGDIVATEDMYHSFKPYFGSVTHMGVLLGKQRYSCPSCGSSHVDYHGITVTPAGTQQVVMQCKEDNCLTQYKVSKKVYEEFLK